MFSADQFPRIHGIILGPIRGKGHVIKLLETIQDNFINNGYTGEIVLVRDNKFESQDLADLANILSGEDIQWRFKKTLERVKSPVIYMGDLRCEDQNLFAVIGFVSNGFINPDGSYKIPHKEYFDRLNIPGETIIWAAGGVFGNEPYLSLKKNSIWQIERLARSGYFPRGIYSEVAPKIKKIYIANPTTWPNQLFPIIASLACVYRDIPIEIIDARLEHKEIIRKKLAFIRSPKYASLTWLANQIEKHIKYTAPGFVLHDVIVPGILVVAEGVGTIEDCLLFGADAIHVSQDGTDEKALDVCPGFASLLTDTAKDLILKIRFNLTLLSIYPIGPCLEEYESDEEIEWFEDIFEKLIYQYLHKSQEILRAAMSEYAKSILHLKYEGSKFSQVICPKLQAMREVVSEGAYVPPHCRLFAIGKSSVGKDSQSGPQDHSLVVEKALA